MFKIIDMKQLKELKILFKTLWRALMSFKIDAWIAGIGILLFILWIGGLDEAFFGVFLTPYAVYTAFRLRNSLDRQKNKVYKGE